MLIGLMINKLFINIQTNQVWFIINRVLLQTREKIKSVFVVKIRDLRPIFLLQ
jgi:hypothetical protein